MNIFVLDRNIRKCARYHCDQHVKKNDFGNRKNHMHWSEEENSESSWQISFTWVIGNIFLPDKNIKFLQIETIMEIRLWGWWWRKPWGLLTTFGTRDELISESWEASAIDVEEAHGSFKKAGASSKATAF